MSRLRRQPGTRGVTGKKQGSDHNSPQHRQQDWQPYLAAGGPPAAAAGAAGSRARGALAPGPSRRDERREGQTGNSCVGPHQDVPALRTQRKGYHDGRANDDDDDRDQQIDQQLDPAARELETHCVAHRHDERRRSEGAYRLGQ